MSPGSRQANITIDVPDTLTVPLSTWDVGLLAGGNNTAEAVPPPVELGASFTVPASGSPAEQVVVSITAPGVATPTTPTTADRIGPGETLDCSWRYAPPVPNEPTGYDLPIVVTARYMSDGDDRTVSESAAIRVPAPPAPTETVHLGDCDFSFVRNGYGPVERNRANGELAAGDGPRLKLGGTTYDSGLGVHAPSQVSVNLDGQCDRFTAVVGIDDAVGSQGSAGFVVRGDGEQLFVSDTLTGGATAEVDVDVSGVRRLDLIVDNGGNNQANDHADWAAARIIVDG